MKLKSDSIEIITDGSRKYELLIRDLENARESISIEYFLFSYDSGARAVLDVLKKKAREGVKVRFLSENVINCIYLPFYLRPLRKAGVDVRFFTPFRKLFTTFNQRNHRKIVVIDDRIGYIGGMNINNRYFWEWRDTHLRVEGPAVAQMHGASVDGPIKVIFDGPDQPDHPIIAAFEQALAEARYYIYIQTPYFTPTPRQLDLMADAANRGVDVRIMLPRTQQKITFFMRGVGRCYYPECLRRGIRIYERIGPFMHSKTFVCDDLLSCIGSANIDWRSCRKNYEANAYIYDREAALENKRIFMQDLAVSEEMTLDIAGRWSAIRRFWHRLVNLFAPLL